MIVLKICASEWINASRDKRELSVCRELGADVIVVAKGNAGDYAKPDNVDGFKVYRYSTRPLKKIKSSALNRLASLLVWAKAARSYEADIISGHDYIGLLIGYIANIGASKKAKLVYDSHEFEIGRNSDRGKLAGCFIAFIEKFLMKKCAFSIMVNNTIADEVTRIHKLNVRPIVVRSTPNLVKMNEEETKAEKQKIIDKLGKNYFILMYHGGLVEGRGIETLLEVVSHNKNTAAAILGPCGDGYMNKLKNLTQKLNITERVIFMPAVSQSELYKYVGAADVGMILAPASCENHLYSLPNKFFENIQAETPVICPNYVAMKEIIDKYLNGLTCDPCSIEDINEKIEMLRTNKALYSELKENTKYAKTQLCWENEKQVLVKAYSELLITEE